MSLYKDASLVMIPSAYKDGKLYSIRPTDGSGDFTFSRGSNLAATRVDVNGLIEKGRENAITYSNTFNTGWNAVNASVTSGQSGYDGSNNAWLFSKSAAHGNLNINLTSSSSDVHTFSLYAKANASDWMRMTIGSPRVNVFFNVANGTLGEVSASAIDTKIESVGNGWYRVSFSTTYAAWVEILPAETMNDTGGASGSLYIQDAQVEKGLVATDYIETGASAAKAGILEDMPRLDYSASCPSLLLEPQRANLITQSEYFGSWNNQEISVTDNATTSPEGVVNAASLVPTTNNDSHYCAFPASPFLTSGQAYTQTYYVKANGYDFVQIHTGGVGMQSTRINYQLSTEEVKEKDSGINGTIEAFGNGWYKLTATRTAVGNGTASFNIGPVTSGSAARREVYTGNGTDGIYVYGAQLEQGSYPTSYIPTYGTSQTRSNDDMDTTFSSAIATNGSATIFFHDLGVADSDDINTTSASYRYQASTGNYVSLTTNDTAWRVRVQGGGSSNFKGLNDHPKTSPIKLAVIVSSTHYSIFANGVKEVDNESLTATGDFSSIQDFITNIQDNTGVRKAVQHLVFPTALTDSECIALTS